jgi:hypothetical protein
MVLNPCGAHREAPSDRYLVPMVNPSPERVEQHRDPNMVRTKRLCPMGVGPIKDLQHCGAASHALDLRKPVHRALTVEFVALDKRDLPPRAQELLGIAPVPRRFRGREPH